MIYYFTYDNAVKIIDKYSYLVGKDLESGEIHYLCVVPSNPQQGAAFMSALNQNDNPSLSLMQSGFDKSSVRILLIYHDRVGGNMVTSDIDAYLSRNNIEKVYDSEGVFIAS